MVPYAAALQIRWRYLSTLYIHAHKAARALLGYRALSTYDRRKDGRLRKIGSSEAFLSETVLLCGRGEGWVCHSREPLS